MPIPIDLRKKPASVKVHVTSGAGIDIAWSDGHSSHYDFAYLRDECPCATCNDERIKKSSFSGAGPASAAALPMFKPKARAQAVTDGHATGIYSYDHLRSICPCADCAKAFREAGA